MTTTEKVEIQRQILQVYRNLRRIQEILGGIMVSEKSPGVAVLTCMEIKNMVFEYYNQEDRNRRWNKEVTARHVACYLCRKLTDTSYPQIARAFSLHHTSIIHAVEKIEDRIYTDPLLNHDVQRLTKLLEGANDNRKKKWGARLPGWKGSLPQQPQGQGGVPEAQADNDGAAERIMRAPA